MQSKDMTSETLIFDPTRPDFRADPYPTYERLRREDPVHWCPFGFWAITRYHDVASLLRDSRLGMGDFWSAQRAAYLGSDAAYATIETWMLLKDPPEHTRLRRLVSQAFTPRAVEQMRTRIEEIVKRLLAEPIKRGEIDVMTDLAFPLPVYVIADMLGVPPEDRDQFHTWTQAVNLAFEAGLTPEQISCCNQGARELGDYLRSLIVKHRKQPRDDLLSAMIEAEDNGQRLTEEELIGNAGLLLAGGFETTMGLIGNGVLALLQSPAELQRLQGDPSLVPNAVEEFLRYNSPVQYTGRWALEEFALLGRTIRRGELVCLYVAAANRDPERFRNPDRLDVTRADIQHLSFGGGRHYCLGAPLARLEAEVVFRALIPRLHDAELTTPSLEWRESSLNHALERLPVRFKSDSSL